MNIWICIPVFNRVSHTLRCLESLQVQTFRNFSVVICDHGSTDGSCEQIAEKFPEIKLVKADNSLWWTGAINRCISYVLDHAEISDAILTMNNDNEVPEDYLCNLYENHCKYPNSILTSVVHDIKNGELIGPGYRQIWWLATAYPVDFDKDHLKEDINVAEVTHAAGRGTLFPVRVFQQLGLFDERHLPHYAADYDFTFKASRAKYPIYSCRNCRVFSHLEETGLVKVLDKFSIESFKNYFFSTRSPGNLAVRWWYGWNNCPKWVMPVYFSLDMLRVSGAYFKNIIKGGCF